MAEGYLSCSHVLLRLAQKDVQYIFTNNHISTLVVLKRYSEAAILAASLIEKLELDVQIIYFRCSDR